MAKVLLLDKQAHMIELLRGKFELEGFDVLTASTGEEGLALAQRELPDLIVLDERLLDGDGVPLAERLKGSPVADIPVILLTSRTGDGSEARREGGISSVQMPFRPSQLLALIRENL